MSDRKDSTPQIGSRPRSTAFLRLSPNNPYAQLEVSPLAPTEEIKDVIDQRRGAANKRLKAKVKRETGDLDEKEVLWLDSIAEEIGDENCRGKYDERYPQNILLTIQQSPGERAWQPHRKAGLISEWLYELLGEAVLLPTPRCLKFWAPAGLDQSLIDLLAEFASSNTPMQADNSNIRTDPDVTPSLEDLDRLTKEI